VSQDPHTILIAEDDPDTRLLYHDALVEEGYKVIAVENGMEVLFNLEKEHIDLIITDSSMPLMDAFQFINIVRQKHPDLPIIVITGRSNEADYVAKGCDIQAFFKKPVEMHQVQTAIRQILEKKRVP
jgi:two-component system response regulator FlrC